MESKWRKIAKGIISEVLADRLPPKAERKALTQAYPFGERARWPYKVWLDEIKRQKGLKRTLYAHRIKPEADKNQMEMF